ncbi:MAG TPA: tetratricopeptide repeat protein, partial [Kofleriaceae bacterium]|nr:tetratricopeptide repeat protein [Kofleriaceae bacterium]
VREVEDGYLFHHALIRDGVYSSLTRGHRGELHRAAAAWFEARDPVLRAQHLDLAEDAGAASALAAAARSEAAAHRIERALELAARGRAQARGDEQRHELAYLEGELLRDAGRGSHAVRAFEDALATAADDIQRLHCALGVAAAHRLFAPSERAFALLDQVQPIAEQPGREPDLAALHYHRGSLLFASGRHSDASREHEHALQVAQRLGSRELEARALSGLADSAYAAGDYPAARDHFRRCLELAEGLGLERFVLMNRVMYLQINAMLDGWQDAIPQFTDACERARRIGHRYGEMFAEQSLGFAHLCSGSVEAAVAHCEAANRMSELLGSHRYTAYGKFSTAALYCYVGDWERARSNAAAALEVARSADLPIDARMCELLIGVLDQDASRRRAAVAEARQLMTGRSSMDRLNFWQLVVSILALSGDWADLDGAATELESSVPCAWSAMWARLGHVVAAFGSGRRDPDLRVEARAVHRRALELGMLPRVFARVDGLEAFMAGAG